MSSTQSRAGQAFMLVCQLYVSRPLTPINHSKPTRRLQQPRGAIQRRGRVLVASLGVSPSSHGERYSTMSQLGHDVGA